MLPAAAHGRRPRPVAGPFRRERDPLEVAVSLDRLAAWRARSRWRLRLDLRAAGSGSRQQDGQARRDGAAPRRSAGTLTSRLRHRHRRRAPPASRRCTGSTPAQRCSRSSSGGEPAARPPKRRYSAGSTNRLTSVVVTRPPSTTTAIGCTISSPGRLPSDHERQRDRGQRDGGRQDRHEPLPRAAPDQLRAEASPSRARDPGSGGSAARRCGRPARTAPAADQRRRATARRRRSAPPARRPTSATGRLSERQRRQAPAPECGLQQQEDRDQRRRSRTPIIVAAPISSPVVASAPRRGTPAGS